MAALSQLIGVLPIAGPIAAIILGHVARRKSQLAGFGDSRVGRWGFILGIIMLVLGLIALGLFLTLIVGSAVSSG